MGLGAGALFKDYTVLFAVGINCPVVGQDSASVHGMLVHVHGFEDAELVEHAVRRGPKANGRPSVRGHGVIALQDNEVDAGFGENVGRGEAYWAATHDDCSELGVGHWHDIVNHEGLGGI